MKLNNKILLLLIHIIVLNGQILDDKLPDEVSLPDMPIYYQAEEYNGKKYDRAYGYAFATEGFKGVSEGDEFYTLRVSVNQKFGDNLGNLFGVFSFLQADY